MLCFKKNETSQILKEKLSQTISLACFSSRAPVLEWHRGKKKCQAQLTLYANLQQRNICYYKGTVWYNPELSPLGGGKEGICFHTFAVKYAYTLRSHSDEISTYVPSSELSMTFNMLLWYPGLPSQGTYILSCNYLCIDIILKRKGLASFLIIILPVIG